MESVFGRSGENRTVQTPGLDEDVERIGAILQSAVCPDGQVIGRVQSLLERRAIFNDFQRERGIVGDDHGREVAIQFFIQHVTAGHGHEEDDGEGRDYEEDCQSFQAKLDETARLSIYQNFEVSRNAVFGHVESP